MMWAAQTGNHQVVEMLLEAGAQVDLHTKVSLTTNFLVVPNLLTAVT